MGIIVGVVIVGWQAVTGASMGTLFPSYPQYIQDLNIGFVALGVNIIVSLIVSVITRKKAIIIKDATENIS